VIIPAVFATLFGARVGGLGAAIGIFISDMLIHGNPVLSLMAGVTSNFLGFALVGYIAHRKVQWKIPMLVLAGVSALLVWIAYAFLASEYAFLFSVVILISYIALLALVWLTPRWRNFEIGCIVGLLVGSAIIGVMIPVFSQFFIMPGETSLTPLAVAGGFTYFVWTFSTEIPFLIIGGPLVLEACYLAYPAFRRKDRESIVPKNI
jgi:hypothetical protein